MLSHQELYNQAMREITSHRQIARVLADETLAELEAAFPALAAANKNMRTAGIQLSITAASGGDTAALKQALADAKAERDAILAESGRPADCLSPKFNCALCDDTGLCNSKVCSCVQTAMHRIRRAEVAATTSLSITKFEEMNCQYYPNQLDPIYNMNARDYMQRTLSDLKDYAEDFDRKSVDLLLFGNSGLGKTHAALAIAGIVLQKGFDVIYISSPDFFSTVEHYHFNNNSAEERALLASVTGADLLILDDLGTEVVSSFTISTLYNLLNNRTAAHLPTIFTSNIIDANLFEKRYTEKIASRLLGTCEPFQFIGDDIRKIKSRE